MSPALRGWKQRTTRSEIPACETPRWEGHATAILEFSVKCRLVLPQLYTLMESAGGRVSAYFPGTCQGKGDKGPAQYHCLWKLHRVQRKMAVDD